MTILQLQSRLNKNQLIHGEGIKILTPKQIFQRLPIALAQVKAGNTSENLYDNMMNSIKL